MEPSATTTGGRRTLLAVLRVQLGWIALVTVAVLAGAAVFSWSRTPIYRADAAVVVDSVTGSAGTPVAPNMETEKTIASSGVVLEMAAASLHVGERELEDGLSITVPADSHVLRISYAHRDPREARRRAQTLADAYVAFHAGQQLADPSASGAANPGASTGAAFGGVQAIVITRATVPRSPVRPDHAVELSVALLAGLALGVGSALVRDRLDDRMRGPDDLEAQAGRPLLGTVPKAGPAEQTSAGRLVTVHAPDSPAAGAYRNLRALVLHEVSRRHDKALLVTSPSGDGTADVAANLAAAVAQAGWRVVLVCADLRRPRTHELFGVENRVGLASVVAGDLQPSEALFATGVKDLLLLPAGRSSDPDAVLLAPAFRTTLARVGEAADLVVVDAPPALEYPDSHLVAEYVEMILLVVDPRQSTAGDVRATTHDEQFRDKVVGCVWETVGPRRHPRGPDSGGRGAGNPGSGSVPPRQNGRVAGRATVVAPAGQHPVDCSTERTNAASGN